MGYKMKFKNFLIDIKSKYVNFCSLLLLNVIKKANVFAKHIVDLKKASTNLNNKNDSNQEMQSLFNEDIPNHIKYRPCKINYLSSGCKKINASTNDIDVDQFVTIALSEQELLGLCTLVCVENPEHVAAIKNNKLSSSLKFLASKVIDNVKVLKEQFKYENVEFSINYSDVNRVLLSVIDLESDVNKLNNGAVGIQGPTESIKSTGAQGATFTYDPKWVNKAVDEEPNYEEHVERKPLLSEDRRDLFFRRSGAIRQHERFADLEEKTKYLKNLAQEIEKFKATVRATVKPIYDKEFFDAIDNVPVADESQGAIFRSELDPPVKSKSSRSKKPSLKKSSKKITKTKSSIKKAK